MYFLPLFTSLVAVIGASAASTCKPSQNGEPSPVPQFEALFSGVLHLGTLETANASFGIRIHSPIDSATFVDSTGKVVARAVTGGADDGIVTSNGIFFPEVSLPIVWEADKKYAYLRTRGVGQPFGANLAYVHLETDSEIYSALNGRFLVSNVTFPPGQQNNPTFTLFGAK